MNIPLYRAAVDEIHVDDALVQKTLARLCKPHTAPLRRWVPAIACACLVLCMIGGVGISMLTSSKKADSILPEDVEPITSPQKTAQDNAKTQDAGAEKAPDCAGETDATNAFSWPSVSSVESLPALEYQGKCYPIEEAIALLQSESEEVPRELLVEYVSGAISILRELDAIPEEKLTELEELLKGETEE